jgi:hypothetical protein
LATVSQQNVCHSSYVNNMRGKAASVKVKDLLNKRLLSNRGERTLLLVEGLDSRDMLKAAVDCGSWNIVYEGSPTLTFYVLILDRLSRKKTPSTSLRRCRTLGWSHG